MNILLNGASGRIGRLIESLAEADSTLTIVGRGRSGDPLQGRDDAEVVIDFSSPGSALHALSIAEDFGLPFVSGTTGLDEAQRAALDTAAERIAICHEANFSIGVHVLDALVREAARRLGDDFDIEILETHHRHKVDAPSGTALALAASAAAGRGLEAGSSFDHGDRGGRRRPGRIGIQALRGGDVVGEHEIHFLGAGERLTLAHRAADRSLFARGALRAARWMVGRSPGRYGLSDLLADGDAEPARD
ncbi:4-hydroxy-tetrahydrodipicolinate reductase [Halomonas denitrificans]|nr:4-hydroxy-tetrahydrodipicolinate reductase [Halomonas denitrificans]